MRRAIILALLALLSSSCERTAVHLARAPAGSTAIALGGLAGQPVELPIARWPVRPAIIPTEHEDALAVAWWPDGTGFVLATSTSLERWQLRANDASGAWADRLWQIGRQDCARGVAVAPNGRYLVVFGCDGAQIHEARTGARRGGSRALDHAAFLADSTLAYAADTRLAVLDIDARTAVAETTLTTPVACLAAGDSVVISDGQTLRAFDRELHGELEAVLPVHVDAPCAIALSADGRQAHYLDRGTLQRYDLETGELMAQARVSRKLCAATGSSTLSHDAQTLVSRCGLFDLATLKHRARTPSSGLAIVPSPVDERALLVGRSVSLTRLDALRDDTPDDSVHRVFRDEPNDAVLAVGDRLNVWDWRTGSLLESGPLRVPGRADFAHGDLLLGTALLRDAVEDLHATPQPLAYLGPGRDTHVLLDDARLFVLDRDQARLLRLDDGRVEHTWTRRASPIVDVRSSPDGGWVVVVSMLDDAPFAELFNTVSTRHRPLRGVVAADAGLDDRLALAWPTHVEVVDARSLDAVARCDAPQDHPIVRGPLRLTRDGGRVVWLDAGTLFVCAVSSGEVRELALPAARDLAVIGDDGLVLATGSSLVFVDLVGLEITSEVLTTRAMHAQEVAFGQVDGRDVVVVRDAARVHLWDVEEARLRAQVEVPPGFAPRGLFPVDDAQLVLSAPDGRRALLDVGEARVSVPQLELGCSVHGVSESGRLMAAVCAQGEVKVWDRVAATFDTRELGLTDEAVHLVIDEDAGRLAWSARTGGQQRLGALDLRTGTTLWSETRAVYVDRPLELAPGGATLVHDGRDRQLDGQRGPHVIHRDALAATRDFTRVLATSDLELTVRDTDTGQRLAAVHLPELATDAAFNADGSRFATTHDHGVILWDTTTMQPTQAFNIARDGTVSTWSP